MVGAMAGIHSACEHGKLRMTSSVLCKAVIDVCALNGKKVRLAALQTKAMPAFSGSPLPHRLSLRKAFTCFAKLSVTSL